MNYFLHLALALTISCLALHAGDTLTGTDARPESNFQTSPFPKPGSMALLGAGLAGLGFLKRRY